MYLVVRLYLLVNGLAARLNFLAQSELVEKIKEYLKIICKCVNLKWLKVGILKKFRGLLDQSESENTF